MRIPGARLSCWHVGLVLAVAAVLLLTTSGRGIRFLLLFFTRQRQLQTGARPTRYSGRAAR